MRIGVDVDGVLADFNSSFINLVIAETGVDLFPKRPFDIPTWNYPEYYGYTAQQTSDVWEKIKRDPYFWSLLPGYPLTRASLEYLNWRQSECRDDVYFITARPGQTAKQQTEFWLRESGAVNPTVLISDKKGACAVALELNCYIDDRLENANDVAREGVRTFLMDRPWNKTPGLGWGIQRVTTVIGIAEATNPAASSIAA